jgi:hypothetical protein
MRAVTVLEGPTARFAFRTEASVIASLITRGVRGVYLLLNGDRPIYVGRSDRCLRLRLMRHGLLPRATHLTWFPCNSAVDAYRFEAGLFHSLLHQPGVVNQIHPVAPAGVPIRCPFCAASTRSALLRALNGTWQEQQK